MNNNISCVGSLCFGCGLCSHVCPTHAIEFKENNEGFLYPFIDESKCVSCRKCLNKCPSKIKPSKNDLQEFIGFQSPNDNSLVNSSSGGIATFLAEYFIEQGGYVCGCVFGEKQLPVHIVTNIKEDIVKMQSSKYVQSKFIHIFPKIRKLLEIGNKVLVFGTPCQISGLKSYFGDNDNLFTVDLICHGVPSPRLFELYIKYLQEKEKSEISNYNFRYKKRKRWGIYFGHYLCKKTGKQRTFPLLKDPFGNDFIYARNFRESCYVCPFSTHDHRPGDLTIGDFWGADSVDLNIKEKKGVSEILINSAKGKKLIKDSDSLKYSFDLTLEKILLRQGNLVCPTKRPACRNTYYEKITEDFFKKKRGQLRIKDIASIYLPNWLKKRIKRFKRK